MSKQTVGKIVLIMIFLVTLIMILGSSRSFVIEALPSIHTRPEKLPTYDAIVVNILNHHALICGMETRPTYTNVWITDPTGDYMKQVVEIPCSAKIDKVSKT